MATNQIGLSSIIADMNTTVIYEPVGSGYRTFKPGSQFVSFDEFKPGRSYIIDAKQPISLPFASDTLGQSGTAAYALLEPSNFTVISPAPGQLSVTWLAPIINPTATSYTVEYSTDGDTWIGTRLITNALTTTYVGLAKGSYILRIKTPDSDWAFSKLISILGAPPMFTNTLIAEGSNTPVSNNFITFTSAAGNKLKYIALPTGSATPCVMSVFINSVSAANNIGQVSFYSRYLGQRFAYEVVGGSHPNVPATREFSADSIKFELDGRLILTT